MCSPDGRSELPRVDVQAWLRFGAEASGIPGERVGTHSLRIGGATALFHIGWSFGMIQRFGRWKSDAFHGYLWDRFDGDPKTASAMAASRFDLHAGILGNVGDPGVTWQEAFARKHSQAQNGPGGADGGWGESYVTRPHCR